MYCPKCSQQQASEELRFCSRCGFPLGGVSLLLQTDGVLPQVASEQGGGKRGPMIKESIYLTLTAWAIAILSSLIWQVGGSIETIAKVGSLIFFVLGAIGLLRFVYAFLFVRARETGGSRVLAGEPRATAPVLSSAGQTALPPAQAAEPLLSDYPRRTKTKEMAPRMSVTENTTRLLDE